MRRSPPLHCATIIHGWDPALYNEALSATVIGNSMIGWTKSQEFLKLLSELCTLSFFNLPGFCAVPEPCDGSLDVAGFADHLSAHTRHNNPKPEVLIGFSFGGAVALSYKTKYHDSVRLVLVSPAIKRRVGLRSHIAHALGSLVPSLIKGGLKRIYQASVSRHYRLGSPFLRDSYDRIARQDLTGLIEEVPAGEILFVFGDADTETPWKLVKDKIVSTGHKFVIIEGAPHHVIRTHPKEVVAAIQSFLAG